MVGLVLCGHGDLPAGLRQAAAMIFGPLEAVETVALRPDSHLDVYRRTLEEACTRLDTGDGVLVLADLFGGSPGNTAAYLLDRPNVAVVTGANLPALLEVLAARALSDLPALIQTALEAGRTGVRDLRSAMQGQPDQKE